MTHFNILTESVPVLATVALFRSHIHGIILGEMERFNQSKHFPSMLISLFQCPLCLGSHAAWIWALCTNPAHFLELRTLGYVLLCALLSFALHNVFDLLVRLQNTLEIADAVMVNHLPKAVPAETPEPTEKEVDDARVESETAVAVEDTVR